MNEAILKLDPLHFYNVQARDTFIPGQDEVAGSEEPYARRQRAQRPGTWSQPTAMLNRLAGH
jgi:hypothetical protein